MKYKSAKSGYKISNRLLPKPILELFPNRRHRYETRNKQIPNIINHKSITTNKSFMCKDIGIFINLPYMLKRQPSYKTFAKKLMQHMLENGNQSS